MTTQTPPVSNRTRLRLAAVIFLAQSFFSASTIAAFTLSPIIAANLSGSETSAGIPNTLTLIGRALFAFPFGTLMDRFGRRLALAGGYFFSVLGALISIWAILENSYVGFLAGAFLFGMSRSSGDQSRFVAAEIFPIERRAKVIGTIIFAGTIGAIGGPLLVPPSTRIMASLGLEGSAGPFVVAAAAMLIASLIVAFFLFPDPKQIGRLTADEEAAADSSSIENYAEQRPLREIFASPLVILATLAMTIGYFVMAFIMVITPLHMAHHDHSTTAISTTIMWHTLGMFGLSWLTGYLIDRFGRIAMIAAGSVILILSTILAPLSTGLPLISLALFLLGLGWNFSFVAGSSLLSDALSARERARAQGAAETLVSLAAGGASLGVGFVFQRGDIVLVSLIGFVLAFLLLVSLILLTRLDQATRARLVAPAD